MPKRRQLVVKEAFERLSSSCGGSVTMGDIRRVSGARGIARRRVRSLPLTPFELRPHFRVSGEKLLGITVGWILEQ